MAGNALEILQMSCFCASFIVWNGYIPNSRKLHVQRPYGSTSIIRHLLCTDCPFCFGPFRIPPHPAPAQQARLCQPWIMSTATREGKD